MQQSGKGNSQNPVELPTLLDRGNLLHTVSTIVAMPCRTYRENEKHDAVRQIRPGGRALTAENLEPRGPKLSADRMREGILRRSALLLLFMQPMPNN